MSTSQEPGRSRWSAIRADIVLVGGGLANGLIAYRLRQLRPDLKLLLIERSGMVGGNHTWSFHSTDLAPEAERWIAPFVVHRWSGQEVRFPQSARLLSTGYRSITAERFRKIVHSTLEGSVITGADVMSLQADRISLAGGCTVSAGAVIDGRGWTANRHLRLGYQKFLGLEVETIDPHGRTTPLIMDATVAQEDGFRFVYVLPLGPKRLLIEDTYYSDEAALEAGSIRRRIREYAAAQGWSDAEILREERGILPIVTGGDIETFIMDGTPGVIRSGLAGAFCHPVTGYALPDAVRLADYIAALPRLDGPFVFNAVADYARIRWRSQHFLRLLARMLFRAASPKERWRVLRRFYTLPEALIERFYAGQLVLADKIRILCGEAPVPIGRALAVLRDDAR